MSYSPLRVLVFKNKRKLLIQHQVCNFYVKFIHEDEELINEAPCNDALLGIYNARL